MVGINSGVTSIHDSMYEIFFQKVFTSVIRKFQKIRMNDFYALRYRCNNVNFAPKIIFPADTFRLRVTTSILGHKENT